ncbi:MAG: hypothetical protein PHR35_12690 [Kiritimatiellae bacterium]|nr:hypothetical protein [Kiritimatiellia bacterium]
MLRKNRKRRLHANVVPVPFIGAAVLIVSMAVAYVWIDTLCGTLGQQIRKLESKYEALDGECRREQDRWTAMKSPENIELALQRHGLNMALPRGEQLVRLSRQSQGGDYRPADRYAGGR